MKRSDLKIDEIAVKLISESTYLQLNKINRLVALTSLGDELPAFDDESYLSLSINSYEWRVPIHVTF